MLHSALFDQADMDFSAPLSKPGQQYSDKEQPMRFTNKQQQQQSNSDISQGPVDKIYQTLTSLPGKNTMIDSVLRLKIFAQKFVTVVNENDRFKLVI